MSLTAIIALVSALGAVASPWLPVVGPIITNLWSAFWNWKTKKDEAQASQNSAVLAAEQQHENDGVEIVKLDQSLDAQDAALNQLNDQLNHPDKVPVLPQGANK